MLANALVLDFINAIKPANPTLDLGIGHEGPIARYIAAVVPLITGETPPATSVATKLKKLRSESETLRPLRLKQRSSGDKNNRPTP